MAVAGLGTLAELDMPVGLELELVGVAVLGLGLAELVAFAALGPELGVLIPVLEPVELVAFAALGHNEVAGLSALDVLEGLVVIAAPGLDELAGLLALVGFEGPVGVAGLAEIAPVVVAAGPAEPVPLPLV